MEHLIEFRNRLVYSVVALVIAFILCYLVSEELFAFLVKPLVSAYGDGAEGRRMLFPGLHEAFFTYLKPAFLAALFLAFPVIAADRKRVAWGQRAPPPGVPPR